MKKAVGQYEEWLRQFREATSTTITRTTENGVQVTELVNPRDPRIDRMHHAPRRRSK
jgi:hypothetical protein